MIIRRALIFAALLALGMSADIAQAQTIVQWVGEPSTVQAPAGTHQLPSSSGCALPTNNLSPIPTCITQGQLYGLATMEVTVNGAPPGVAFTWAVTSGTLPPGLNIDMNSGLISGTPTKAGVYSFIIGATHGATTNSIVYTMAVGTGTTPDLPVITQTLLPAPSAGATAGSPLPTNWYTAAATLGYPCVTSSSINSNYCAVNGTTPYYNWSIQGGSVDGLGINPTTGAFTGTPLSGGTFSLTLQAVDGLDQTATWATTVTIGGAANFLITTSSLPTGVVGTAYTPTVTTQGGLTPITFTRVSGNLPPGVIDCAPSGINCAFSGTPTVAGTYNFSLQASYTANSTTVNSNIQPYTVVIAQQSGSSLALPAPATQSVALGQSASMTFAATGGTAPYTYNTAPLFAGPFPPGLTMNATTGVLSGTTTATGTYNFTVEVTDNTGAKASAAASMSVGNTLSLPTPAAQTVSINQAVSMQFTASGGVPSYTYALISGGLPPNLSLNGSTGLISGTISSSATATTYTFTIRVTDSSSNTATAQTSITVNSTSSLTLPTPASQTVTVGQSTSMQFTATGGTGTGYSYTLASGSLPPGLALAGTTGLVSGTPTTAGTYTLAVTVTDSGSNTATSGATSITVSGTSTTLTLPAPASQTVTAGQSVNMQFTATGGSGTGYNYTLASGSLPPGLSLTGSTGLVSGTPTTTGTYTFAINVKDSASNSVASGSTSITVNAALTMASPSAVTGVNNNSLTIQFTAAGGTAPYTYSITGVTLNGNTISIPSQLTINSSTGLVTFATTTATASGPYAITVKATDSASNTVSAAGTITVGAALTMANPPAILNGIVGQAITMQFTAAGGTLPYTYAFVGGNLPQGLTLNTSTGSVSGTPTATGNYGFTIQVTDSATPPLTATASGNIVLTNLSLTGSNVSITIANSSGTNLNGTAIPADTQPNVTVTIASPLSQNIQGTIGVSLKRTFDSAASNEVSFPAGQQVNFQIPAGSTTAVFGSSNSTQLKVGTAAGSGQIQAIFQDSLGNNITPQNLQNVQFSVAPAAPVINCPSPCGFTISGPTPASGTTAGGQYIVTIIGYSTTLNMTGVSFTFTPTSGTNLASTTVTVPLTNSSGQNVFANWFGNSQSNQYGGEFTLQVPLNFTVSGGSQSNPIAGATVTLTNSQGTFTSGVVIPSTP